MEMCILYIFPVSIKYPFSKGLSATNGECTEKYMPAFCPGMNWSSLLRLKLKLATGLSKIKERKVNEIHLQAMNCNLS